MKFSSCMLYPLESETRELKSLDGIWKFQLSPSLNPEIGFNSKWYANKSIWLHSDNSDGNKGTKVLGCNI